MASTTPKRTLEFADKTMADAAMEINARSFALCYMTLREAGLPKDVATAITAAHVAGVHQGMSNIQIARETRTWQDEHIAEGH